MSQKIDPREVLIYLNALGYTNINAQQLKEFITDLKKLIKYEYRHGKENIEHVSELPSSTLYGTNYGGNAHYSTNYQINVTEDQQNENVIGSQYKKPSAHYNPNNQINNIEDKQNENVFDSLYKKPTVSSRAKEIPKREKQISVHITKARNRNSVHDHCTHLQKESNINTNFQGSELQLSTDVGSTNGRSQPLVVTEASIKSVTPDSSQSLIDQRDPSRDFVLGSLGKSSGTKVTNSKSAFMRSSYSKPINKCDPVALYHHYQQEWKKQKFPGQESHADLRWAVREKLLKGPKVVPANKAASNIRRKPLKSWQQ